MASLPAQTPDVPGGASAENNPESDALWGALAREQRWRGVMETLGNNTWEYNLQTKQLRLSTKYQQLLGYYGELIETEMGQAPLYANIAPDERAAASQNMAAYLSGERPLFEVTYRLPGTDGTDEWVLSRGMVTLHDDQGAPLLITGTHTDITAVTNANLAAETASLRLGSTIASLQHAVLLEDEHRRVILVNDAFCRLFGLAEGPVALVGTSTDQLAERIKGCFNEEATFTLSIGAMQESMQAISGEPLLLRDGRTLLRNFTPVQVRGIGAGFLWKYEDITRRVTESEALKRRERKYRSILENLNLGLIEVDLAGQVTFVNDSYCQLTGYTQAELLHHDLDRLQVNESYRQLLEQKTNSRARGISDTYELPIKNKHGELRWLLVSGTPVYDDEQQFTGSIGVHLDITHQKQLEAKLRDAKKLAEESSRAKEMFLANMSHEIRTPMNAILGMSQLLARTALSPQQNNYLHAIATSAENLLVIINDILDLSKIDAGKMLIEKIGFSLPKICEQVEKTLHYKAEDKGLSLVVEVDPNTPEVLLGDPHRLVQVLLNLAGNSIKFTEKGEVHIGCALAGIVGTDAVVEFTVRDTGIGMAPAYVKKLFQTFSQENASISRQHGGTGLGLNISMNLVCLMGGDLQVTSEKGQGTHSRFSLVLPIGTDSDLPRNEMTVSSKLIRESLHGKRVLLVEDNAYNRMLAKSFLRLAHIVVTEAENGAAAVELARTQEFDLILMDLLMPVMSGYDATNVIRNDLKLHVPIIALTANALRGDNQKCLDAGMNDYLSKPYKENDLLKIVHEWVVTPRHHKLGGDKLYRTDTLKEASNNDPVFVAFMLRTFLQSGESWLATLHQGFREGNMEALKEATHKIRPSLMHLHIYQVLRLVTQLEAWEGAFDGQELQPIVEVIDTLLRQTMNQMTMDLEQYGPLAA
ncbi:PAS domain S-box protein [Hymenobacter sp. BT683]|uniref:histidine kinase n=1 Tax=Hymenobacter jeongseonensis TaxID=2791027 RepID=A0ABS0IPI4_9BACT|nr:PAS domain S-box protein [Hymenobacter jeongseonensis]MBF9239675.1 PAS domain S-box protein [Hymenobacter jeongseonensis]